MMETILTVINPIFDETIWKCDKKEDMISYKNKEDEFVIKVIPKTGGIKVSIPMREVIYYNTFYNLAEATEYLKMHIRGFAY
jgi:hypothetical protein